MKNSKIQKTNLTGLASEKLYCASLNPFTSVLVSEVIGNYLFYQLLETVLDSTTLSIMEQVTEGLYEKQ